jgi:ATP-dependent helicase HepA
LFCSINFAKKDGLGKVVQVEGTTGVVEYFDSPANIGAHRISVPTSVIKFERLGKNTRVFAFDDMSNQWTIGRVREDDGTGVEVRLPHKKDVYLPYDRVFVRWKRPIEDPVGFLGNFVTETPQYAEARSGFMRNYVDQRGAAFGISALLSSSIDLEPHQIEVVRRVLTDRTQRYLLADEVGLGKTIEAGIIIRQAVLDDMRGHRVIVLVPRELVAQWREQLSVRFGLSSFLDESVFVLPQEESSEVRDSSQNLSLLVIDEAHHLTASNANESVRGFFGVVREIAHRAERLLLLSATPILRNESGFLQMLNLLDPVVYPLDDLEGFRAKVSNRQALAETVAALDPSNSLFMDSVLDELSERLPNDPRLRELSLALKEMLLNLPDESDPDFRTSVRQLRAHISETYRLNRRILRNRRTQVGGLTPGRKGAELWWVESSSMHRVEAALEDWRVEALLAASKLDGEGATELADFYWNAVRTLNEGPAGLSLVCSSRQLQIDSGVILPFQRERELLDAIRRAVDSDSWLSSRAERLHEGLLRLPSEAKTVVFCSTEENADRVFSFLKDRSVNVVRHGDGDDPDSSVSDSWRDFLDVPKVRAIVCGQRAEEGINLQGGSKVVVHFDLPLQPNRVEQRMGRVDRYGAGNPVPSFVLVDESAPLQLAWFRILDDGLGVFDRSISSLQYLVEMEIGVLSQSLVLEGAEGFDSMRERLAGPSGAAARELRLIDQQDALDQLSPVPEQELDNLFDADADWRKIREAMMYWIGETLLFRKVNLPQANGTLSVDDTFRFQYCSPNGEVGPPTLIPLSEFHEEFLGAIDFDAHTNRTRGPHSPLTGITHHLRRASRNRSSTPQSYPHVTHRTSAVKRLVRPLRYGTEFVEAIRSFCETDVRGRSYAMWRQVPGEFQPSEIRTCFRFDFMIETDLSEALKLLAQARNGSHESSRSSLARQGDTLFRPTVVQIWLDEEGDELAPEFVEKYLTPKYAKDGGDGYVDKNLDTYLTAFRNWSPDTFENWGHRCGRMRETAMAIVTSKPELLEQQKDSLRRALAEDEVRYAQLRTRIQSLDGREATAEAEQLALEMSLNEALHRGISSPSVKIDVAGAVFLTSEPVSLLAKHLRDNG